MLGLRQAQFHAGLIRIFMYKPLTDMRVVTLALNLPGPLAAKRLVELGADVIKVEPPEGDPFEKYCPDWYAEANKGQQKQFINLKSEEGQAALAELLRGADLLLTAQRPAALDRLGLDWESLHERYPQLNHVAIVGYPYPKENHAGHDLTYQASLGLITPPHIPKTLVADLAGAERSAIEALGLLIGRKDNQKGRQVMVALSEAAEYMSLPLKFGMTSQGAILSGIRPEYAMYETASGWVAIAALEPHFCRRLQEKLGLDSLSKEVLAEIMKTRSSPEWVAWADEFDIPLVEVKEN